jgi:protoporphyrin/coproporphyrin ferrochelatase
MRYLSPSANRANDKTHLGVLLVNSGTPASPEKPDIRRFLRGLLGDPRVIELPRMLWNPILYGFILPFRPGSIAEKYRSIWTTEGSPLVSFSNQLRRELTRALAERLSCRLSIELGMLYSPPSVISAVRRLQEAGIQQLLVVPLFPQYSGATTGAAYDHVSREILQWRWLPELRFVNGYADQPAYIEALKNSVTAHWRQHGRAQHLVISFHGIPQRYADAGDPYFNQCQGTAHLLAKELALQDTEWSLCFQSRFGAAPWLKPYTIDFVKTLPKKGIEELNVICPGFAMDCLETVEEIAVENRDAFLEAGGKKFSYVPALNAEQAHTQCLAELIVQHSQGWGC